MRLRFKTARSYLFVVVALLTSTGLVSALKPSTSLSRLTQQTWTVENGLPQNTVSILMQSRSGYLWLVTELGLVRFDGNAFKSFDRSTIASFPDAEVRCLLDARSDDWNAQESGAHGELWVGTANGLIRLQDGRSTLFTRDQGLPDNSVRGVVQAADNKIWVWTESGLAFWDGGRFRPAGSKGSALGRVGAITSIAAGRNGSVWVAGTHGVAMLRQGVWQSGPGLTSTQGGGQDKESAGLHTLGSINPLVVSTSAGSILIATDTGIYSDFNDSVDLVLTKKDLPHEEIKFLTQVGYNSVAIGTSSSVTVVPINLGSADAADAKMVRFRVQKELPGNRIQTIYADGEGCLWIGTNRGMARLRPKEGATAAVELPLSADPLATDAIESFLEDREGDMWVGTDAVGLHILREARFLNVGVSEGLSSEATTAIVQDTSGAIWIGTRDSGLNRVTIAEKDAVERLQTDMTLTAAKGLQSNVILSLASAPNGDLWVGTPDGLNRVRFGPGSTKPQIESLTSADGFADDFIRSLLVDPDGSLWIGTRRGLTHMSHGRITTLTQHDGLGSDLVGAIKRAANGDLWIGTLNGLSVLHDGSLRTFKTQDGLSSNIITALDAKPDGKVWIGTQSNGLNLWDGRRVRAIAAKLPGEIHAILHDDMGYLWLASNNGLTRASVASLVECADNLKCDLTPDQLSNFTTADGLRSRGMSSNSHPTALKTIGGELWFTSPRGVVLVDPNQFPVNAAPPPVAIEQFSVDDLPADPNQMDRQPLRIGAHHLRLEFDYVGLSFAAPQRLRFQYMLEGFDRDWVDAGVRRSAYYTNIPPGSYLFRVRTAFGEAGLIALDKTAGPAVGSSEADVGFVLLPRFYQTWWFWLLVLVLIAVSVLLVFQRRIMHVERELRAVMAERNRIAREIHDTLAQGYVGISLQLEILGELLRHNRRDAAITQLATTKDLVREGLDDARQSIWALRSQDTSEHTLPVRLRRLVEQAQTDSLTADFALHGAFRSMPPGTEREILRIAQEAIQNVKRHAEASRLSVHLDYEDEAIIVSVTDDGKGFEWEDGIPNNDHTTQREGVLKEQRHYGLVGMKERAALIGAELSIRSTPREGTVVTLRVPLAGLESLDTANERLINDQV